MKEYDSKTREHGYRVLACKQFHESILLAQTISDSKVQEIEGLD
jgi:hypothetical protein